MAVDNAISLSGGNMAERIKKTQAQANKSIQLAEILESISDGFLALDREWRIIYVNQLAASQVKSTPRDIIGQNFWQRFTRLKGTELEFLYRKAMIENRLQDFEIKGLITDTWYHFRIYPSAYGILVYFQDITGNKKVEEAIKMSEAQLKSSQEIAHLGSWELDLRNDHLTWSDEVYRIFGLKPQEFSATYEAFLGAVHPDDRQAVDTAYSGSVREGRDSYEIEHRIVRKSTGEVRFVHEKCTHVRDKTGHIIRSIGMVHDITERKKAEEALLQAKQELEREVQERTAELQQSYSKLKQSEEKYRTILETAGEGIIAITPEGIITFVNTQGAEMFGYSIHEMVGKPAFYFVDKNYMEKLKTEIENRKSGGSGSYEIKLQRKDGSELWAKVKGTPLIYSDGHFGGSLGLFTDITEEKKLKDQLQMYAKRITQVQEEERKVIAFELHDDTAQYLSILKMQLNSLLQSGKIHDPEVLNKLQYLEKDADRAFNDVRRYSHELRPGVLDHLGLHAAIEQIAEDINKLQQISVEVNVEGTEPSLSDEVKLGLFRIAQEALSNARKHSKGNLAKINLKYRDHTLEMAIADNGVGFELEKAATQSTLRGSLGLMSLRERADLIGASLEIDSQPGQGTVVRVKLPMKFSPA